MAPARAAYLKGTTFGLAAASIWAGWSAVTRLAVTTGLDAADIAALRFGVAGLLLVPVLLRRGLGWERLGWRGLAVMIAGGGAPYALIAAEGMRFAPAADQGALNSGMMPLFVALIAAAVLGERPSPTRKAGLALILAGAIGMLCWHAAASAASSPGRSIGDALLLAASFCWASFTIVFWAARIDPLHAAALVSTGSLLFYFPVYLAWHGSRLLTLPLAELAFQALFQGVLVTIVSLLLYGRAVALLGAAGGAAFGALVPALAALIAIPLLGEWPDKADWLGILLVTAGVYLTSGGPMPWKASRA